MSDLSYDKRSYFWLLNNGTGEVYPLGPMYGTDPAIATLLLKREHLSYAWTLLAPVSVKVGDDE
jgi:hypothetical protein